MVKGGPLRFAVIAALAVALAGFVVSPALSGPGFLTDDEAAKVFLKKKRASKVFLKKKRANNRFLTKKAATSRYYSKTEADGRFLRPEGEIRLGVATSEWVSGDELTVDYNANEATFPGGGNDRFAITGSTIPTLLYGRQVSLKAVELCYVTFGDSALDAVFVRLYGTTPTAATTERSLVIDDTDRNDSGCRTYAGPATLPVGDEVLNVTLRYDAPAAGLDELSIRRLTVLLEAG